MKFKRNHDVNSRDKVHLLHYIMIPPAGAGFFEIINCAATERTIGIKMSFWKTFSLCRAGQNAVNGLICHSLLTARNLSLTAPCTAKL